MKTTTAFAPLTTAAAGIYVSTGDTLPMLLVLGLFTLSLAAQAAFVVLYVCRKADRKDLRELLRAWRDC